MTKPDITAVPTLAGRELDAAVHAWLFLREVEKDASGEWNFNTPQSINGVICRWLRPVPHYSRDRDPSLFDVLERMDKAVLRKHKDVPAWYTAIVVANGVCKEADGDTLNEALARAALLTTYPTKEAADAR